MLTHSTGLSASDASRVIESINSLIRKRKVASAVLSIHQPRPTIWNQFTHAMLLSGGRAVYNGPREQCAAFFKAYGRTCPLGMNEADWVVDLISAQQVRFHEKSLSYFGFFCVL